MAARFCLFSGNVIVCCPVYLETHRCVVCTLPGDGKLSRGKMCVVESFQKRPQRLFCLAGTFCPPHNRHLEAARIHGLDCQLASNTQRGPSVSRFSLAAHYAVELQPEFPPPSQTTAGDPKHRFVLQFNQHFNILQNIDHRQNPLAGHANGTNC